MLAQPQAAALARVVAQYQGQLILPWRRYAIGQSDRGERPARGRYREFWQADVDIVGSNSPVADAEIVPQALLHNLKHNQVLHEQNLILTVAFHDVPWIPFAERVEVEQLVRGFWRVKVNYGFKNKPDIPRALELCHGRGLEIDAMTTSYFLSREVVVPVRGPGMAHWREALFAAMSRNSGSVVEFFRLPNNAVIELGTRIQI